MGPYRTAALIVSALLLASPPVAGQQPGWHYSPLPGEGDRASMGCARGSDAEDFTCLVVRCEDDYTTGIHLHASREEGATGAWGMTLDRETRLVDARPDMAPYDARLADPDGWLLDGLRHGSFVYLRHTDDAESASAFIDLTGSLRAIEEALYWCAPRVPPAERNGDTGVGPQTANGELQ